jgi:hypothetical protein
MESISGSKKNLQYGVKAAWSNFILFIVYDIIVITGLVTGHGILAEPFLTIAEIMTIASTPLLIFLVAVIHEATPKKTKVFGLTAFAWMILLAGTTTIVHFVNLTLWRQISVQQQSDFIRLLGWEWPSMLFAAELASWHLFFGLSVFFASFAFQKHGREKAVRVLLMITGILCIAGMIGPLLGDLRLRTIGIAGYAIVFPIACIFIARVFKNAPLS